MILSIITGVFEPIILVSDGGVTILQTHDSILFGHFNFQDWRLCHCLESWLVKINRSLVLGPDNYHLRWQLRDKNSANPWLNCSWKKREMCLRDRNVNSSTCRADGAVSIEVQWKCDRSKLPRVQRVQKTGYMISSVNIFIIYLKCNNNLFHQRPGDKLLRICPSISVVRHWWWFYINYLFIDSTAKICYIVISIVIEIWFWSHCTAILCRLSSGWRENKCW